LFILEGPYGLLLLLNVELNSYESFMLVNSLYSLKVELNSNGTM